MRCFNHRDGEVVSTEGAEIYFERIGAIKAPAIVLLHGGIGTIEDLSDLAAELTAFQLIAIDSRAHGKSSPGDCPLTYAQLTRDVQSVTKHLGIARFSVLGFSDGGIVGYRLAIEARESIEKLITIGAPAALSSESAAIFQNVTAASWCAKFPETRAVYEKHNPQPNFESFFEQSKKMWLDTSETGYPGAKVSAICCPTLIIRGDDDHLFSLSEALWLREQIQSSHLMNIAFAGHVTFADQPEMCALAIKRFLER